ncbi:TIGR00341 family protein [Mucilaginibacter segetis]|uniref:TIGR00341 family protein n=1 Tax=Mucilaginibacter segetis TaxID=2793071 RepID=A0A934PQQ7_9SPHI|nr:TIGR00341 family protein [Mucilaginibacter segetis]MBK0379008.1 TIGR00341 family protein [Mucilaginibacter segetis]
MDRILREIRRFIINRFSLNEDKADELLIIESIRKNVEFRGANLWALIFAIVVASIGLNVNSTAVIIGAMLISPIMGPVMGVGLGIGINDFDLVKKGGKNLLVASIIGIISSTIYFLVTPLHEAQSELLARTSPSIWDVFIAFFGGLAGMVAASRKEKNNVIPGVAIATALMPPLCTAGFGIAMGNWYFFLGAIYLYFINSVFITIATYLVARYLKMTRHHFDDAVNEKKVNRYIIISVVVTIVPSIFMAYRIVDKSIFETNARKFVDEQFKFKNTQVVSKSYVYSTKDKAIDLLLIGNELDKKVLDTLNRNLAKYSLKNVELNIRQGLNAKQQIDFSQIKASILEDVFSRQQVLDTTKVEALKVITPDTAVLAELKVLYPAITSFGFNDFTIYHTDTTLTDTIKVAIANFTVPIRKVDQSKLQEWLRKRYQSNNLKLIVQ